jgi:hypothetical protein
MHAQEVISTLATRVQHRRKTATQLKSVHCVLQFRSMISVITVQQELRKKFEEDLPTANLIRKWYKKFVDTSVKGKIQANQVQLQKQ